MTFCITVGLDGYKPETIQGLMTQLATTFNSVGQGRTILGDGKGAYQYAAGNGFLSFHMYGCTSKKDAKAMAGIWLRYVFGDHTTHTDKLLIQRLGGHSGSVAV